MNARVVINKLWAPVLLFVLALSFSTVVLNLHSKWWYEDDPGLYWKVNRANDPISIFLDPIHLRTFATGKALVPVQMLSYWIDIRLFGVDVRMAYVHSIVVFALAIVSLYAVLRLWTNTLLAMFGALLWMILPSSLAVHYFISARHYVEGFVFSLLACLCTVLYMRSQGRTNTAQLVAIVFLTALAMLSKEIYATTLPAFLFVIGIGRRKFTLSILGILLVIGYSLYRFWVLGADLTYTEPLLDAQQYLQFLVVLPYTISASNAGYLLYGGMAILISLSISTKKPGAWRTTILASTVLLASLIATYSVANAVLVTYRSPGTWYRVPMIINSILIIWGMYLLHMVCSQRTQIAIVLVIMLCILPGTIQTKQLWDERMQRAELEGRFYLSYPDRLLYSEEDAWWYIMGIHALYETPTPHYINKQMRTGEHAQSMLKLHTTIWRYQDGEFIPDPALFQAIKQENETVATTNASCSDKIAEVCTNTDTSAIAL